MKEPFSIDNEARGDWAESLQSQYFKAKSVTRRYWWVMLITCTLTVSYQYYKFSNRQEEYVSRAKMKVTGARFNVASADAFQEMYQNFFGNEIDVMRSGKIQKRARELLAVMQPDLKPSPVSVNAAVQNGTSIFVLSARGSDKNYVQPFLNATMEAYLNHRREERNQMARSSMQSISEQLNFIKQDISEIEDRIFEFQKKNNLILIRERDSSVGNYLNRLKNEMDELVLKQRYLSNLSLDERLNDRPVESDGEELLTLEVLEASANYQRTKQQLDEMVAEREVFARDLKPKHPKMLRFEREIRRAQERLGILRKQAVKQLDEERRSIQTEIENLAAAIKQAESEALDYSQRLAEYRRLESQLARSQKTYDKLLDSVQNIDVSSSIHGETINIYQHATTPEATSASHVDYLRKGLIYGVFSGGALMFLISSLDRRVISTEDLKRNFDEPVLGIIPKETSFESNNPSFMLDKGKRHIFTEAFRTLRSSILFMGQVEPRPNTFIITSAVPEEGKSTIASNLAISLAMASSRTLLVDADLRRGRLNRLFKLPNNNGLIEVLQGQIALEDAIHHTEIENLDFIPRGMTVSNSGELLLGETMQHVIDTVRHSYDFVIFDAAPVLATDDTTSFASKVDSILYVVRSTTIRVRQVRVSIENLKMRGANVSGFIMNFADTRGMDYYYYNKYQYYYRYQSQEVNT